MDPGSARGAPKISSSQARQPVSHVFIPRTPPLVEGGTQQSNRETHVPCWLCTLISLPHSFPPCLTLCFSHRGLCSLNTSCCLTAFHLLRPLPGTAPPSYSQGTHPSNCLLWEVFLTTPCLTCKAGHSLLFSYAPANAWQCLVPVAFPLENSPRVRPSLSSQHPWLLAQGVACRQH